MPLCCAHETLHELAFIVSVVFPIEKDVTEDRCSSYYEAIRDRSSPIPLDLFQPSPMQACITNGPKHERQDILFSHGRTGEAESCRDSTQR